MSGNKTPAHEYMDDKKVLAKKMKLIANLIRKAKCCVAYTGAGLSKASGIPDYATKSKASVMATNVPKLKSSFDARPTFAHCVLAALERKGYLHHYVQQNHDGLPQKAGFPQEKINEIHGAWFDPSNPVVKFSGSLRTDLFTWYVMVRYGTVWYGMVRYGSVWSGNVVCGCGATRSDPYPQPPKPKQPMGELE